MCWRLWAMYVLITLFLSACAMSGAGTIRGVQKKLEIEKLFRSATILPGYTYYVQGVVSNPEAIIAVKNTYQLRSRLWRRVEWTEKEMARIVFWMEHESVGFCTTDGGNLVAPDGQIIGIWYSQRDRSFVKQPESGVVEVYPFDYTIGSPCHRLSVMEDL